MAGVKIAKAKKEEMFFRKFFCDIRVLEYDKMAAEESNSIAAKLSAIGKKVNDMDILIAGIAIANGAEKVITRDEDFREIAKITDIKVVIY